LTGEFVNYQVEVKNEHVYVKYTGTIDGLDIVRLTANPEFMSHFRRLQKVIHDFSLTDEVSISFDQMRDVSVLSKMESYFTEKLIGIVIPRNEEGYARVNLIKQHVANPNWKIFAAKDMAEALNILNTETLD
jgi:hypothetical protein